MNDAISFISAHWKDILAVIAQIIGVSAMIAALTPSSKDDTVIASIQNGFKKVIDILGFNFGNAKNA